jgi:hypothetical protein
MSTVLVAHAAAGSGTERLALSLLVAVESWAAYERGKSQGNNR